MLRTLESDKIFGLVQPLGGLFSKHVQHRSHSDEPRFITRVLQLGNISQVWGHAAQRAEGRPFRATVHGSGTGLDAASSFLPAVAEGLERYCTCVYTDDQFVLATGEELGHEALDLDTIPRCSQIELADPRCPLRAPDKRAPIRWVRGLSLLDGRLVYLPVVMVYLYAGLTSPAERIVLPITTGCAAHISYERALVAGILEVIERDAISITWLQRLTLPRIEIDHLSPSLMPYWERYQRGSKELEYVFLDATNELGIPTVYAMQISRADKRVTTLLACSTALDPSEAVLKVIKDMAACRIAFRVQRGVPDKIEDFADIFHGATYMARAERADAFEFLLQGGSKRLLSEMVSLESSDERQALRTVLGKLRKRKMEAYAVDLSTDEALRAGARVVRVIIPALQPLSFSYRARYLGHSRLYEAPRNMGYPVYREEQLNQWPQPFA